MPHLQPGLQQSERGEIDCHLLLFDLSIYGHHPAYIRHLLKYWHQQNLPGRLTIVVSPRFLTEHADVVKWGQEFCPETIQFLAITDTEEANLKPRSSSVSRHIRNFQEWGLLCKYAQKLQADHALVMYYDTYQYYLALRLNPPCPVSGIYFRPTFHYHHFSPGPLSRRQKLQIYWEKLVLDWVLKNPNLHTLFSLDPFVIDYCDRNIKQHKLVYLPDPIDIHQGVSSESKPVRAHLGIESHRKLLLLFGALTGRKGINQLLKAIPLLPLNVCEQLAIAMIGEASPDYQQWIETQIAELVKQYPIQIVRCYQFVAEEDVQQYFQCADVVLALYQRHVGMSGILIQAAAAQKPVLSSNYGLMGELVKQYQLGLAIDSTNVEAIADGIQKMVCSDGSVANRVNMKQFAEQNLASQFASVIFNRLHPQVTPNNSQVRT